MFRMNILLVSITTKKPAGMRRRVSRFLHPLLLPTAVVVPVSPAVSSPWPGSNVNSRSVAVVRRVIGLRINHNRPRLRVYRWRISGSVDGTWITVAVTRIAEAQARQRRQGWQRQSKGEVKTSSSRCGTAHGGQSRHSDDQKHLLHKNLSSRYRISF